MTLKTRSPENKDQDSENEGSRVEVFVQQMLVTRIFAATYTGRNYIHPLKDYRDVLKVNDKECDLIRDLEIVKKRIDSFYKGAMWASITGPDKDTEGAVCVWTTLENVAFGSYWFMIQHVGFSARGELVLNLKVVRKFEPEAKATSNIFDGSMNWDEIKKNFLINTQELGASIVTGLRDLLTWHNIKESSKFLFLLIMAIGTGLMYALQFLGDYSIKFFREFNNFIRVTTPIFIAVIDLVSKAIGGFYLLLVMLWRGSRQGPMPHFPSLMSAPQQKIKPDYQKRFSPRHRNDNYF